MLAALEAVADDPADANALSENVIEPAPNEPAPNAKRDEPAPNAKAAARTRTIRESKIRNSKAELDGQLENILAMSNPTLATAVSTNAFGYHAQQKDCHKFHKKRQAKLAIDPTLEVIQKATRGENAMIARGLTSHCMAVRKCLKTVLDDDVDYMVHTDCVDEASMWVRRELTALEKEEFKARQLERQAQGKKAAQCKRVAAKRVTKPCINVIQNVFAKRRTRKGKYCQIHSPTQPMAKGNWATYLHHQKKWNLFCEGEVGEKVHDVNDDVLQMDQMPIIVKVFGDEDYRNLFVKMQQLCGHHLFHGAMPGDYEWSKRIWNCMCKSCNKAAIPEHCQTQKHKQNIEWYGVAATRGSNKAGEGATKQNDGNGVPDIPIRCLDHRELPKMYEYSSEWWSWCCLVGKSVATEEHCAYEKH